MLQHKLNSEQPASRSGWGAAPAPQDTWRQQQQPQQQQQPLSPTPPAEPISPVESFVVDADEDDAPPTASLLDGDGKLIYLHWVTVLTVLLGAA
jgi:hypothetical protein